MKAARAGVEVRETAARIGRSVSAARGGRLLPTHARCAVAGGPSRVGVRCAVSRCRHHCDCHGLAGGAVGGGWTTTLAIRGIFRDEGKMGFCDRRAAEQMSRGSSPQPITGLSISNSD